MKKKKYDRSAEVEERLLSFIFRDGSDALAKCIQSNIMPKTFHVPANRIIYETLLEMHAAGKVIDIAAVAEELKAKGSMNKIGRYAYLCQISSRVPKVVQVGYFIERLLEMQQLRKNCCAGE